MDAAFHLVDLTDTRKVEVFFEVLNRDHPLDFVVVFAAESEYTPMGQALDREVDLISQNISIAYNTVVGFGRLLQRERRCGSAIVLSSINAHIPVPGFASYCIAKAALDCLVMCACRELSPFLRVNAVAPGPVYRETGVLHAFPGFLRGLEGRHLVAKRLAQPADIVPAIEFLLSDAAGWVTGQTIVVDGGVSRHWGELQAIS